MYVTWKSIRFSVDRKTTINFHGKFCSGEPWHYGLFNDTYLSIDISYTSPVSDTAWPAAFSAATFASIFFLAAKIISSRLLCNKACLSPLFWLHACLPPAVPVLDSGSASKSLFVIFEARLYRVIKSGCTGFEAAGLAFANGTEDDGFVTGSGGWNVWGGWKRAVSWYDQIEPKRWIPNLLSPSLCHSIFSQLSPLYYHHFVEDPTWWNAWEPGETSVVSSPRLPLVLGCYLHLRRYEMTKMKDWRKIASVWRDLQEIERGGLVGYWLSVRQPSRRSSWEKSPIRGNGELPQPNLTTSLLCKEQR